MGTDILLALSALEISCYRGTYHLLGKIKHSGWKIKINGSCHSFWEASETSTFLLFLVCSADLDVLCTG